MMCDINSCYRTFTIQCAPYCDDIILTNVHTFHHCFVWKILEQKTYAYVKAYTQNTFDQPSDNNYYIENSELMFTLIFALVLVFFFLQM